jgi:hypothetical protein
MNTKGFSMILIGITIAIIAVGGIFVYKAVQNSSSQNYYEECGVAGCDNPALLDFNQPETVATQNTVNETGEEQVGDEVESQNTGISCNLSNPRSVTTLSPNGGENYNTGDNISVQWDSCNETRDVIISLLFVRENPLEGELEVIAPVVIGSYSSANDGQENISIPENVFSGKYKIHVDVSVTSEEEVIEDYSNEIFTINNGQDGFCGQNNSHYSIDITSPSLNDYVDINEPIVVAWDSCNLPINILMQPILISAETNDYLASLYPVESQGNLQNDGLESYTLSQEVPEGLYRIKWAMYNRISRSRIEGLITDTSEVFNLVFFDQ